MKKSEMAATIDRLTQENKQLEEFRVAVAEALQRPNWCSLENLTRYAREDIAYLRRENEGLKEKIVMYQRSVEVGDDR